MIFGARVCSTTVAATDAPASSGVPVVTSAPSPIISTSASSITAPASPASFSTEITSSLATLYCLPPVRITANMTPPIWVYARPAQPPKTRWTGAIPSTSRSPMPISAAKYNENRRFAGPPGQAVRIKFKFINNSWSNERLRGTRNFARENNGISTILREGKQRAALSIPGIREDGREDYQALILRQRVSQLTSLFRPLRYDELRRESHEPDSEDRAGRSQEAPRDRRGRHPRSPFTRDSAEDRGSAEVKERARRFPPRGLFRLHRRHQHRRDHRRRAVDWHAGQGHPWVLPGRWRTDVRQGEPATALALQIRGRASRRTVQAGVRGRHYPRLGK